MADQLPDDFTRLLADAARNDPAAAAAVLSTVYESLRGLARQRMGGERAGHTLQATALVHELYLRLFPHGPRRGRWANRAHFFNAAAEAMRNILIDHAKSRLRLKRGGGRKRTDLETLNVADLASRVDPDEILTLDEAMCRLREQNPKAGQVVRLKFYGGLTNEEVAEALGTSPETVKRKWAFARAFLRRILGTGQ